MNPGIVIVRGGTSNTFVGEQNSNYLLRKTKLLRQLWLSYTGKFIAEGVISSLLGY